LNVIKYDPPDNRILECAVTSGADYMSGDKDLLRLGQYDAIRIVTVSNFPELARKQQRERSLGLTRG
jgi:predicted nucleic acid-binding protein